VSSPVLTVEQIEFAEIFERLARDFKMTKAAVARALRVERSYITMLVSGQRSPGIRTLEDMRELEKRQRASRDPHDVPQGDNELNLLIHQLKTLQETDPPKFEAAKQVVAALAQTSSKALTPVPTSKRTIFL
jgi:hypothetical protein